MLCLLRPFAEVTGVFFSLRRNSNGANAGSAMGKCLAVVSIVPALIALQSSAVGAVQPEFALPLDCGAGSCLIQNYFDQDPGGGLKDSFCGAATYDGHKGVDFRVISVDGAAKGVPVRAAAAGVVKSVRDGVEDKLVASEADRLAVAGRECGNGVLIDHGEGLETQYCHLRRGSVRVRKGETVALGAALGEVGSSGDAAFAHVHFEARRNGVSFDPFGSMCGRIDEAAWSAAALAKLPKVAEAALEAGFAGAPVDHHAAEIASPLPPTATSPGLVFYARYMNLKAGDVIQLKVTGPNGFSADNRAPPLDRNKATFVSFAGKKLTGARWPAGVYKGEAIVLRGGKVTLRTAALTTIE